MLANSFPHEPHITGEKTIQIPTVDNAPTFDEPWQAQAFALVVSLQQKGIFTWHEWSEALGNEIRADAPKGDAESNRVYYTFWLRALERIVEDKGIVESNTLRKYGYAWQKAAARTRHGDPIQLKETDFE